jgi:minor extracellular protease Epr
VGTAAFPWRYLMAAALAHLAPASFAQLPGGLLDEPIGRGIDRTVDRAIEDRLTRSVEELGETADEATVAVKQLNDLPRSVLDPLLDRPLLAARPEATIEGGWRAVDREWIALLTPAQLPALNTAGVEVLNRRTLAATGLVLVRVSLSDQDNNPARAEAILRGLGATAADRNHIYNERFGPDPAPEPEPAPAPAPQRGASKQPVIGLIDTSLNRKHPALRKAKIVERDFVESSNPRPTIHGTAIASLLVGGERGHEGLLPKARLVAASVFYQAESGATGATTSALVAALDWMATQNVQVVNMSLAGPPNNVLGAMIQALSDKGMIIVAAVGNDGPAARPLYPAAFEPVVAVTAVDRQSQIYRWANRGPQVDFAAWGVGAVVAKPEGGYTDESGTSFAAPIVAATIADLLARGAAGTSAALQALISSAEDLGGSGRDETFGYGLVKPAALR